MITITYLYGCNEDGKHSAAMLTQENLELVNADPDCKARITAHLQSLFPGSEVHFVAQFSFTEPAKPLEHLERFKFTDPDTRAGELIPTDGA